MDRRDIICKIMSWFEQHSNESLAIEVYNAFDKIISHSELLRTLIWMSECGILNCYFQAKDNLNKRVGPKVDDISDLIDTELVGSDGLVFVVKASNVDQVFVVKNDKIEC